MILIHRGYGILIPILGVGAIVMFPLFMKNYSGIEGVGEGYDWTMQVGFLLGSAALFALDKYTIRDSKNDEEIKKIRASNHFFFIRIRWWAFILLFYGVAFERLDLGKKERELAEKASKETNSSIQLLNPDNSHPELMGILSVSPVISINELPKELELTIMSKEGKIRDSILTINGPSIFIEGKVEYDNGATISNFKSSFSFPTDKLQVDKLEQEEKDGAQVFRIPKWR